MKCNLLTKQKAFTVVELVATVALLGVVALLAVVTYQKVYVSVKEQKLKNDQATLNSAINVYRGFGGNVSGIDNAGTVILKLKKIALAGQAKSIPGLTGSMLDPRVTPEWQSAEEAATDELRMYWNPDTMKFDLATSGPSGIRRLLLSDEVSHVPDQEGREFAFTYAKESTWVWDFGNEQRQSWISPTDVQTGPEPASLPPGGTGTGYPGSIPNPGPAALTLVAPEISHPTGAYSIREFTLPVALTNPNPEGSSKIYYTVDYGPWTVYDGTLALAPGATVQTMAVANKVSKYNNSSIAAADYSATSVNLIPPAIQTTFDAFGVFSDHEIGVSITDPNITDSSLLEFRIDGGEWGPYTDPFTVTRQDYPAGLFVEARAIAPEGTYREYYVDSPIATRGINADAFTLEASSDGKFHSPFGGADLVTNIHGDQRKPKVMWGNQYDDEGGFIPGRAQSWLGFTGSESSATVGERVELGILDFYNGTHGAGTGADGVSLDLAMDLSIAGVPIVLDFDFDFVLNNVPNDSNANSSNYALALPSADYVQLAESSQVTQLEANGFYYQFLLEFGDVEANGFSTFDEFHVLENTSASTKVYGTFLAIPASQYNPGGNLPGQGGGKGKGKGKGTNEDEDEDEDNG